MIIQDKVYGKIEVTDPTIIELINSKPFQRLKNIGQAGAVQYIQTQRDVSRYEHSIGVWYLSHLYERPFVEQIAALLHDLPHTAFSHVIDFVVEDEKHEYHERFMEKILRNSEIPEILHDYGIELDEILHKENFELLDNDLPDISFDRWDYFMRDGLTMQMLPEEVISLFLEQIKERDLQLYFEDVKMASLYAILFMNFSRLIWLDPDSHGSYYLLADALKLALSENVISEVDFFTTDAEVMEKLRASGSERILHLLSRLSPKLSFEYAPREQSEFFGPNKPRFVDPLVLQKGQLVRLSKLVPNFNYYFSEFSERYKVIGVRELILK